MFLEQNPGDTINLSSMTDVCPTGVGRDPQQFETLFPTVETTFLGAHCMLLCVIIVSLPENTGPKRVASVYS